LIKTRHVQAPEAEHADDVITERSTIGLNAGTQERMKLGTGSS